MIWNEIRNLIGEDVFSVLIADSIGQKQIDKLNILAEYYPEKNAFFASNAYSAMRMLKEVQIKAEMLFADAGFDCEELVEERFKLDIKPIIKQRKYNKTPRRYRKLWKHLMINSTGNSGE